MKLLPVLAPLILASCIVALCGCDTAANRRELYNTTEPNGPWHDYERNRLAQQDAAGLPPATTPVPSRVRPTPPAPSGPSAADQAAAMAPTPTPAPAAEPSVPPPAPAPAPAAPLGDLPAGGTTPVPPQ